jgi:copper homeostasis protein
MHPLIEVCVEGLAGAKIAIDAGADRLELNSSLDLDGLTPVFADLIAVKELTKIPVIAMLRPHATSFMYDRATQLSMLRDLEQLLASGADGIAVGGLTPLGEIDCALMTRLRKNAANRVLVMHRAFDQLRDQTNALEQLIDLGIDRVLTSGGAQTAEAGMEQLRRLVVQSRGRIEILPGAGIRPSNASAILEATGCDQLHGTFKRDLVGRIVPEAQAIVALKQLRIRPDSVEK